MGLGLSNLVKYPISVHTTFATSLYQLGIGVETCAGDILRADMDAGLGTLWQLQLRIRHQGSPCCSGG